MERACCEGRVHRVKAGPEAQGPLPRRPVPGSHWLGCCRGKRKASLLAWGCAATHPGALRCLQRKLFWHRFLIGFLPPKTINLGCAPPVKTTIYCRRTGTKREAETVPARGAPSAARGSWAPPRGGHRPGARPGPRLSGRAGRRRSRGARWAPCSGPGVCVGARPPLHLCSPEAPRAPQRRALGISDPNILRCLTPG